ncbi:unnamed protein product [Sphagnum jensenii]|uniref:Uncharacterized protein n=1 Tax=Sphagnum jensenii TaxID=128206 RepID=A0ABP0WNE7_9BRYO
MTPCPNQNSAVSVTDLPPLIQLFPFFSFFQQWLVLCAMHQLSACCIVILLALGGFIVSRALDEPKAVLSQESFDEKMRTKIGNAGNVKNGSLTTSSESNPQIPE